MKRRPLPPSPPDEWDPADAHDSRGPGGAYCPRCNTWNAAGVKACRRCGHKR